MNGTMDLWTIWLQNPNYYRDSVMYEMSSMYSELNFTFVSYPLVVSSVSSSPAHKHKHNSFLKHQSTHKFKRISNP